MTGYLPTGYFSAERYLNGKHRRPAARFPANTEIIRNHFTDETDDRHKTFSIRLWGTSVVTFHLGDLISLNTGGYLTTTTQRRINLVIGEYGWRLTFRGDVGTLRHVTGVKVPLTMVENVPTDFLALAKTTPAQFEIVSRFIKDGMPACDAWEAGKIV